MTQQRTVSNAKSLLHKLETDLSSREKPSNNGFNECMQLHQIHVKDNQTTMPATWQRRIAAYVTALCEANVQESVARKRQSEAVKQLQEIFSYFDGSAEETWDVYNSYVRDDEEMITGHIGTFESLGDVATEVEENSPPNVILAIRPGTNIDGMFLNDIVNDAIEVTRNKND